LGAQHDEGDHDPVGEAEPLVGAGTGGPLAVVATALAEHALVGGGPRVGELGDQVGEVLPGDAGEDRMGEGRTGPCWFEHPCMLARAAFSMPNASSRPERPSDSTTAIAHQLVRSRRPAVQRVCQRPSVQLRSSVHPVWWHLVPARRLTGGLTTSVLRLAVNDWLATVILPGQRALFIIRPASIDRRIGGSRRSYQ